MSSSLNSPTRRKVMADYPASQLDRMEKTLNFSSEVMSFKNEIIGAFKENKSSIKNQVNVNSKKINFIINKLNLNGEFAE